MNVSFSLCTRCSGIIMDLWPVRAARITLKILKWKERFQHWNTVRKTSIRMGKEILPGIKHRPSKLIRLWYHYHVFVRKKQKMEFHWPGCLINAIFWLLVATVRLYNYGIFGHHHCHIGASVSMINIAFSLHSFKLSCNLWLSGWWSGRVAQQSGSLKSFDTQRAAQLSK